jgi:RNA polymerase sigma-70 factor (ECF subfamily)
VTNKYAQPVVLKGTPRAPDALAKIFWLKNTGQVYVDPSKGRLFTWMLNITKNLSIDTMRAKSYKQQSKIQSSENVVNHQNSNINENDKFDTLGIREQVTLLKKNQKQIIDLAYFEGFTQVEISEKLGIPLGTVKTRMRTAVLELKKLLQV